MTALAENKMRDAVSDSSAQFSRVQVTGDDKTGQTCGYMSAKVGAFRLDHTFRFIVYIDGTAGPYVEGGFGKPRLAQDDFDRAWQADCMKEGYAA